MLLNFLTCCFSLNKGIHSLFRYVFKLYRGENKCIPMLTMCMESRSPYRNLERFSIKLFSSRIKANKKNREKLTVQWNLKARACKVSPFWTWASIHGSNLGCWIFDNWKCELESSSFKYLKNKCLQWYWRLPNLTRQISVFWLTFVDDS